MNPEAPYQSKEEKPNDGVIKLLDMANLTTCVKMDLTFRSNWEQTQTSVEVCALLPENEEEGPEVSVAGRRTSFSVLEGYIS